MASPVPKSIQVDGFGAAWPECVLAVVERLDAVAGTAARIKMVTAARA